MKKITVIKKYTCDLCGDECKPVKEIAIDFSYSGTEVNRLVLKVSAYIPWGERNGDVCEQCLNKALNLPRYNFSFHTEEKYE